MCIMTMKLLTENDTTKYNGVMARKAEGNFCSLNFELSENYQKIFIRKFPSKNPKFGTKTPF